MPPTQSPIKDPIKLFVQSLVEEDSWEWTTGKVIWSTGLKVTDTYTHPTGLKVTDTYTHPTGVRVDRKSYGGLIFYTVYVENQVYENNFAKTSFNKLTYRRKAKEKAVALQNLVQKVIDYNEKGVVLGDSELESGIQSLRFEHQSILAVDWPSPEDNRKLLKEKLRTSTISISEYIDSMNRLKGYEKECCT